MENLHVLWPALALIIFAIAILVTCMKESVFHEDVDDIEVSCSLCGQVFKGEFAEDMLDDHIYSHREID